AAFAANETSADETDSEGSSESGFVPAVVSVLLDDHDHDHDDELAHDDTHHEEETESSSSVLAPSLVDSVFVEYGASCLA
ncbi:MAG: nuclease, partial [Rhodopirellula bahusiensis]